MNVKKVTLIAALAIASFSASAEPIPVANFVGTTATGPRLIALTALEIWPPHQQE